MKACWPITLMCEVLEVSPSGYFSWDAAGRRPVQGPRGRLSNEALLAHIRAIHERLRGEYGWPRMHKELVATGLRVGKERVRRLMRQMGLVAIYPKPNLSRKHPQHAVFPYLLRELDVTRPNQVWAMDITYLPIQGGFIYLCAVIDWYSRAVLAWGLSNTLDASFCVTAVDRAIAEHGVPAVSYTHLTLPTNREV